MYIFFVSEKSLELGVDLMDREHKELVKHANTLFDAIKNKSSDAVVLEHLKFLAKYTVDHFKSEEAFQRQINYPGFNDHKKIHEDFKLTVTNLLKDVEKNGITIKQRIDVNTMTINWLRTHIGVEDKKVATFYLSQKR